MSIRHFRTNAEILRAKVDRATSGELIAATSGRKIVVLSYEINLATANTLKFQSASTDLTGAMTGASFTGDGGEYGCVETAAGEALNIALGSGVQTSGWITYISI